MNTRAPFTRRAPSREAHWRSIVLFGRNVASYKFALSHALLDLAARDDDFVPLDELAVPFSEHICRHLELSDVQGTSPTSRFLAACRQHVRGEVEPTELIEQTVRLGFTNVLDAFHVVGPGPVPTRFFVDERRAAVPGIRLTDELRRLALGPHGTHLPLEADARWRLVETSWELKLPAHLIEVTYDAAGGMLTLDGTRRRRPITAVRHALNGYQEGRCFYCGRLTSLDRVDVDHLIPWSFGTAWKHPVNLDGVWNLVLACPACNRGPDGKFARVPTLKYLEKLHTRNEYYVASAHPLRETIVNQTGGTPNDRAAFLTAIWNDALDYLPHPWEPDELAIDPTPS